MNISLKKYNFDWLPMLLLTLSAGSLLFVFFRKEMLYTILVVFAGLLFFKNIFKSEVIKIIQLFGLFSLLLVINYVFAITPQSSQKLLASFVIFLSSVFAALYYSRGQNQSKFIPHLYVVLRLALFHSLINFLAYPLIKPFLFEISNERYNCQTFFYLFYYLDTHSIPFFGFDMIRNQGVFWEPGILQIYLNLLFFIEAFIYKKRGLLFWLTIIGLLTTFSTTGLLVLLLQLVIYFFSSVRRNIYFTPVIFLILASIYFVTVDNIRDKVSGDGRYSFQARFFDLVQPLYLLKDYPLTGVGLDDEQYLEVRQFTIYSLNLNALDFSNRSKGSTNSVMFFLAATGIPFTLIVLLMLFKQQFVLEKRKWFFIFIIISLMTEPLLLRPFFLTFVMSGGIYFFNKFRWIKY